MWSRRSHMLAHLTIITSNKKKFEWTKVEQDDFDKMKWTMDRDTSLSYPDF